MMARDTTRTTPSRPNLRERQKRRTRSEISQVALELFEERGVERTMVDDIVERAEVSQRTFFRHFATKEDAALLIHHDFGVALRRYLDQGGRSSPLSTLCGVYSRVLADYGRGEGEAAQQMLRVRALMLTSPALHTAGLRLDTQRAQELLEYFMAEGEWSVERELGVRMAVETTAAAVRVTLKVWNDLYNSATPADAAELFDQVLASAGIDPGANG